MTHTPQSGFTPRSGHDIAKVGVDIRRAPQEQNPRGFTLLIAVILSSVALALALALIDIAYKQVTLALTAKQSQYAFAAADSALECALYYDQKLDAFNHASALGSGSITCGALPISNYTTVVVSNLRTTSFSVACADVANGVSARVTVLKESDADTAIYANGYNNCNVNDTRRIERGLRVTY